MASDNNVAKVSGVIYAKPVRNVTSQKTNKEYEFKSIILELKREYKGKTYREFPEFHLGFGVADSGFETGDNVEITYVPTGKKISDTFHKTELKAIYIRHTDIDYNDLREVAGDPFPKREKAQQEATLPIEENDDDDLPF